MRVLGVPVATQQRKTFQVLKWVGLQHRMNAYPEELSGGEQQRIAIARALVNDPQLVLADEPTGNLDPDLSLEIMNLFREINARGTTVVVATHDRELIRRVGRRADHARSRPRRRGRLRCARCDTRSTKRCASLWRGRQAGLLSTATIALALFVLGGFLLVTANLERLGAEWSSAAELSVYLKDDVTPARAARRRGGCWRRATSSPAHEYVSKAEALARFKQTFGDLAAAVDGARRQSAAGVARGAAAPGRRRAARRRRARRRGCAQMPGVADVRYDRQWLDRLLSAIDVVRGVGLVLGAVLTIAAALTVANVVRLALYARRDELEIMQLVGAPQAYVRGPFVMEGVLQGGIGALVALVALAAAFLALRGALSGAAGGGAQPVVGPLPAARAVRRCWCVGGMAVGCLGGLVAAWNR